MNDSREWHLQSCLRCERTKLKARRVVLRTSVRLVRVGLHKKHIIWCVFFQKTKLCCIDPCVSRRAQGVWKTWYARHLMALEYSRAASRTKLVIMERAQLHCSGVLNTWPKCQWSYMKCFFIFYQCCQQFIWTWEFQDKLTAIFLEFVSLIVLDSFIWTWRLPWRCMWEEISFKTHKTDYYQSLICSNQIVWKLYVCKAAHN